MGTAGPTGAPRMSTCHCEAGDRDQERSPKVSVNFIIV